MMSHSSPFCLLCPRISGRITGGGGGGAPGPDPLRDSLALAELLFSFES